MAADIIGYIPLITNIIPLNLFGSATSPVNDSKVFAKTENHLNKASPIFTIKDKVSEASERASIFKPPTTNQSIAEPICFENVGSFDRS